MPESSQPRVKAMTKTLPTLAEIVALDAAAFELRHWSDERRRPPRFQVLVEVIRAEFPDLKVDVSSWSYEPWVKQGRLRRVTGRVRHGKRLTVAAPGSPFGHYLFDYKSSEPYSSNWDVVRWIAEEARRRGRA